MRLDHDGRLRAGIVGLGYMGLATGLGFAAHGLSVLGYDKSPEVCASVARGSAPYKEAGLRDLLRSELRSRRFGVVDSVEELVERSEGIFLCVPTPSLRSGRIDLRSLKNCAEQVGSALKKTTGYRLIVVKSTVVPGTTSDIVGPIIWQRSGRSPRRVGIAANPEFLAEGAVVHDALFPYRVVLGTDDPRSLAWLEKAYRPFRAPVFSLTPTGAELVKYSANSFLALKVSFANEISRLADRLGESIDAVMSAVGQDPRIGSRFLQAGPGFGGSCFEKDLQALRMRSADLGVPLRSAETALQINEDQLTYSMDLIRATVGPLSGKRVALLGLSFKAGTDDVRGSRALLIAQRLVRARATVRCHDPQALENFRRAWQRLPSPAGGTLELFDSVEETLAGVDAAILQAGWQAYQDWRPSWSRVMKRPLLVDLRRALDPVIARRAGLTIVGLGAGSALSLRRRKISRGGS